MSVHPHYLDWWCWYCGGKQSPQKRHGLDVGDGGGSSVQAAVVQVEVAIAVAGTAVAAAVGDGRWPCAGKGTPSTFGPQPGSRSKGKRGRSSHRSYRARTRRVRIALHPYRRSAMFIAVTAATRSARAREHSLQRPQRHGARARASTASPPPVSERGF